METAKANILVALVAAVVCLPPMKDGQQPATPTAAQQPAAQTSKPAGASSPVTVDGSQQWVDTNIDLNQGEKVELRAGGEITYPQEGKSQERKFGPEGLPRSFADVIRQYPVGDAGHGALVGRLVPADSGQPFLVGAGKEFVAPVAGRLFLCMNQSTKDAAAAHGYVLVTIHLLEAHAPRATAEEAGGTRLGPRLG